MGIPPSIGLIEALLLLAENLPRMPKEDRNSDDKHYLVEDRGLGNENRRAWTLIGIAVRCGYALGLDKVLVIWQPELGTDARSSP